MLTEERMSQIVALVEANRSCSVAELMSALDASESTIRRDLTVLHQEKQLVKVRGGAIAIGSNQNTKDDAVNLRKERNRDEKEKIAAYAASLIEPNDFVFLDAGTTTELMIQYITEKSAVFVTNAILHAKLLSEKGYTTYILGGEFKAVTESIVGEEALNSLSKYNFTKGFWGTNGVSDRHGFTTPDVKEAMLKQRSIESCGKCFVLADSSKFTQISNVKFAEFEQAVIITSRLFQPYYRRFNNVIEIDSKEAANE